MRKENGFEERGEEEGKRMKDGKTERKHVGEGGEKNEGRERIKQKEWGSIGKKMMQEERKEGRRGEEKG
jgi:hypothetical protein